MTSVLTQFLKKN